MFAPLPPPHLLENLGRKPRQAEAVSWARPVKNPIYLALLCLV
jgi:hypothetical protein